MTYRQKCERFRELAYEANGLSYPPKSRPVLSPAPIRLKWKSMEELDEYLWSFGGRVKTDRKKRGGYLVVDLNEGMIEPQIVEVPMEFATKVLAMGGFP